MKPLLSFLLALVALAAPQDPPVETPVETPEQEPEEAPLDEAELAAARKLIARASKALEGVLRVDAAFVQTQHSILLDEPLVSNGKLYLRAEPACLVLEFSDPRPVQLRSDATSHRVWERDKRRAERYDFEANDLAVALISIFTADIGKVEEHFRLVELAPGEQLTVLGMVPRAEELAAVLGGLELTVRNADAQVVAASYTNADGEATRLALDEIVHHEKGDDLDAVFDAPLPKGVRLEVHRIKRPEDERAGDEPGER